MDLILFSCKARINGFFRQQPWLRALLLGLGVAGAGVYSWLFAFLLREAGEGGFTPSVAHTLEYTNLFLLALIILKGFFPAYIPKLNLIPQLYPVPALRRFWAELAVELVSPFYVVALLFLVFLFILAPVYSLVHLLQSLLVLLTAHVTLRSLQLLVERKMRWRSLNFYSAIVMGAAFVALQARAPMFRPTDNPMMLAVHTAAVGFLTAASFLLGLAAQEPRRKTVSYSNESRRSLGWRLFRNHKLARQMLLFGLAFKVLILGADAFAFAEKGRHILDEVETLWLFVGPLVVFSYVFNNVWGFYRNLWLSVERSSGHTLDFVKAALLPLRLPLTLDAVATFGYVALFNHQDALFIFVMYMGSVLLLTPLSLVASILKPKTVKGGLFSFSAKSSYLFNFISIGLFGTLFLPLLHPILYLVYPVVIGGAMFALVAVLREYPKYKYKLFETHFKSEA